MSENWEHFNDITTRIGLIYHDTMMLKDLLEKEWLDPGSNYTKALGSVINDLNAILERCKK